MLCKFERQRVKSVTAVIAGGGVNALGVLRSLAAGGQSVMVLDTNARSPAMRSRHAIGRVVRSIEGPEFMLALQQVADELGARATLFLTEEKTVETVSALRHQLPASLVLRLPEHQRLMALMHKQGFYDLALSMGAPVPRTLRVQCQADLVALNALRFPCVFKPGEKSYAYGARFKKAYKVESVDEVRLLYRDIEPVLADMVVQEWIEGSDSDIYFCLQYISADQRLIASFPGRKIRSWPPRIGGTASCTSAWEDNEELTRLTEQFFRQVGFTGMGSMEYKRDVRDGRFYMVEPTVGRTDFQEEVATVNGCNVPLLAHCHEMNWPLPSVQPGVPRRVWRDALADRWSREEGGQQADVAEFERLPVVDCLWRWNDPSPAVDQALQRIAAAIRARTQT